MPLFSFSRFFGDVIFYRSDQLGRHPAHKAVIRHILCHHRTCGYYHIVPYGHAGQDGHIPATLRCFRRPIGEMGWLTVAIRVCGPVIT